MKNDDVALIQRILAGDETAFAELVNKYQKPVHTLAWRKIGDFHIAEDITQETFLKVYQRLHTLKDPNQFSGWLYVITANLCATWLRKKRIQTQPLEDTEPTMIQEDAYSQHTVEERAKTAAESQREVVKQLLAQLKESERTVMTLYYLGEMTVAEISRFLGVSTSTIKSRLRRARQRLQEEEPMIREALEHFQITPNLTENVMREISRLKPIAPSGSKPLVPWAVGVSTVAVIFLMLGIGNQHLSRFQKPYSFEATSEMTVEIIEAPVVLNLESKPDIRIQLENAAAPNKNEGVGQQPDDVLFAAAQSEGEDLSIPKQQWMRAEPVKGSQARILHVTPEGELYTLSDDNLYKLQDDGKQWQHLSDITSLYTSWKNNPPIAKWENTLYILPSNNLFASKDEGKTWNFVHSWSEYQAPINLVLTEQAFYIAFKDGIFRSGILRSKDADKTWEAIHDGLGDIHAFVAVQNMVFAGTDTGFYRWNADSWQRLQFPVSVKIHSVAATAENLYVVAELNQGQVLKEAQRTWWVLRSTDLGNSWTDITPTNVWSVKGSPALIKLVAVDETLLAIGQGIVRSTDSGNAIDEMFDEFVALQGIVRSTDSGNTWMPLQTLKGFPSIAAALNESTFYVSNWDDGLQGSTDGGKSWHAINVNRQSQIDNLITVRRADKGSNMPMVLYAKVEGKIVKTEDQGKSWKFIQTEIPRARPERAEAPLITQIVKSGGTTYVKGGDSYGDGSGDSMGDGKTRIYYVSDGSNTLMPVQDMPVFSALPLRYHLSGSRTNSFDSPEAEEAFIERLQRSAPGATQFFKQLAQWDPQQPDVYVKLGFHGPFAVSSDTFYMEYNFKLFRWKPGDAEWHDTGLEETIELTLDIAERDLQLAVSGDTVYVGKRDGHLVVSSNRGDNWLDLTSSLPFPVKTFKEIVFVGPTVCVATDAGVAASIEGKYWRTLTDAAGTHLIMERLAVDGTTFYGITKETGVYRLESGTWEQIISEIPDNVTSLTVDGNTLYVGTESNGMLHFNLEE